MDCQTVLPSSAATPRTRKDFQADAIGAMLTRAVNTLLDWQERAGQRRQLSALGPDWTKDTGLDPADAYREASKPFWRP